MGVWRGNKRSTEVRGTPLGWGGAEIQNATKEARPGRRNFVLCGVWQDRDESVLPEPGRRISKDSCSIT